MFSNFGRKVQHAPYQKVHSTKYFTDTQRFPTQMISIIKFKSSWSLLIFFSFRISHIFELSKKCIQSKFCSDPKAMIILGKSFSCPSSNKNQKQERGVGVNGRERPGQIMGRNQLITSSIMLTTLKKILLSLPVSC